MEAFFSYYFFIDLVIDISSVWEKLKSTTYMPVKTTPNHYGSRMLRRGDGVYGYKITVNLFTNLVEICPKLLEEELVYIEQLSTCSI